MSQHDYFLDDATGAVFRSDLNDALAAVVTNNSGATEPTTMYAHMWWADTTTGLLKRRNTANTAWVSVMSLDSLSFASPTMTGTTQVAALTASGLATLSSNVGIGASNPVVTGSAKAVISVTDATLYSTAGAYPGAASATICGVSTTNLSQTDGSFATQMLISRNASNTPQIGGISAVSVASGYAPDINIWQRTGAATFRTSVRIHASGGVSINNTTDPGAGNLSVTGAISATATAATDTTAFSATGSTTRFNRGRIYNTGGDIRFGVEASISNQALTGSTAYSSFIGSFTNTPLHLVSNSAIIGTVSSTGIDVTGAISATTTLKSGGYTVATLPAGTAGMRAYVTDATAPTWLAALTGGGAVVAPVFHNGTAWLSA